MHDSWKTYAPMGLPADGTSVALPPSDKVGAAFETELSKAVDAELGARIAEMGALPVNGPAVGNALNKRGVLYAKYGRYDDALRDLQGAAKAGSVSALVNLGNIAMVKSDPAGAFAYYQEAAKQVTDNAGLYVNIARAAAALGKKDDAASALNKVRQIDPQAADKYAELAQAGTSGTRAAEVDSGSVVWF